MRGSCRSMLVLVGQGYIGSRIRYSMRGSYRSMMDLIGHGLYLILNNVLYEKFMQVHVGPCWTWFILALE